MANCWSIVSFLSAFTLVLLMKTTKAQNDSCYTSWSPCFVGGTLYQDGWKDRRVLKDPKGGISTACLNNFTYVNQVDIQPCDPEDEVVELPQGLGELDCEGFRCGTGACIPSQLTCNGDNDCEDASDEYPVNPSCTLPTPITICGFQENLSSTSSAVPKTVRYLRGIPGINQFSLGYDILKGTLKSSPISMASFGSCRRVLVAGETDEYYRLPQNVASVSQSNDVAYTSGETFETSYDLLTKTRDGLKLDPSIGGLLSGVDGDVGMSQVNGFKTMMTKSINNSEIYSIVTAAMHVNVFQVNLKSSSNIQLSTDFIQRIAELPYSNYSNHLYMKLIQDFGTHYVNTATLGGVFQITYTYSRCWLYDGYKTDFGTCEFEDRLLECSKIETAAQFDPTINIPDKCKSKAGLGLTTFAIKKDTVIKGGSASAAANLKLPVLTSENWQAWVTSVVTAPTIVPENFELRRISDLLDSTSINITSERRAAIKQYVNDSINIHLSAYDSVQLCGNSTYPKYKESRLQCDAASKNSVNPLSSYYLTGTQSDYECLTSSNVVPRTKQCSTLGLGSSAVLLFFATILYYIGSV